VDAEVSAVLRGLEGYTSIIMSKDNDRWQALRYQFKWEIPVNVQENDPKLMEGTDDA
jgi:hypothetical protein